MEAPPGIGPGNKGFADLCLTAWLWRPIFFPANIRGEWWSGLRDSNPLPRPWQGRALPNELNPQSGDPNGARTHDLQRDRLAF